MDSGHSSQQFTARLIFHAINNGILDHNRGTSQQPHIRFAFFSLNRHCYFNWHHQMISLIKYNVITNSSSQTFASFRDLDSCKLCLALKDMPGTIRLLASSKVIFSYWLTCWKTLQALTTAMSGICVKIENHNFQKVYSCQWIITLSNNLGDLN